jgi:uncharacterized membrane protein
MSATRSSRYTRLKNNFRSGLLSGIFLLIPFAVTFIVIRWLFGLFAGLLTPVVKLILRALDRYPGTGSVPSVYVTISVTVLTVIAFVMLVYVMGAVGRYVIGRRLIQATEALVLKIPLVRTVYGAASQVIKAVSVPNQQAFKSVVLTEFPRAGFKAVGFLTGHITDAEGGRFCKLFIPTSPNPTTGFFEIVPVEEVVETKMTVEEAFKMVISAGLVCPETLPTQKVANP